MKKKVTSRIKNFFSCSVMVSDFPSPSHSIGVDVREEYANAFRTQSYVDFWTHVVELSDDCSCATPIPAESTSAARLPSYRLFAEYLLDPDQLTVTKILTSAHKIRPNIRALLSEYFAQTANASALCALLLKDIETTRVKYRSFKATLAAPLLSDSVDTFLSPVSSPFRVVSIRTDCSDLLRRLESKRDKARAKLQVINNARHGSAVVLVALAASLSVIIVTHALSFLVALPALISASIELAASRRLARAAAQLDAAAKGTYTLSRDLDTISHLVARLNDELEHVRGTARFWVERRSDGDWVQASGDVARQLKKNEAGFKEQVDELEEHLYLCFMTINRARKTVMKEILKQPTKHPCILSSK